MRKLFIITAVSDKHSHWCVSGISIEDSKHYRLISDDISVEGAVHKYYLLYNRINPVRPLDLVEFEIVRKQPQFFQPENIVINEKIPPKLVSRASHKDLMKYLTKYDFVLFNLDRLICTTSWDKSKNVDRSLELIYVSDLKLNHYKYNEKSKFQGSFHYNGRIYTKISITDPEVKTKYSRFDLGEHYVGECVLLISLGEEFSFDRCRYKLIACVHRN